MKTSIFCILIGFSLYFNKKISIFSTLGSETLIFFLFDMKTNIFLISLYFQRKTSMKTSIICILIVFSMYFNKKI